MGCWRQGVDQAESDGLHQQNLQHVVAAVTAAAVAAPVAAAAGAAVAAAAVAAVAAAAAAAVAAAAAAAAVAAAAAAATVVHSFQSAGESCFVWVQIKCVCSAAGWKRVRETCLRETPQCHLPKLLGLQRQELGWQSCT